MPSKKPRIVLYVDEPQKQKIEYLAEKNNRSVNNYITDLLSREITKHELTNGEIKLN